MKRRNFIKTLSPIMLPVVIPGITMHAYQKNPLFEVLPFINTDRVLVMIQWSGGCDGLNTVIPIDQYTDLANARSNIILPQSSILGLTGNLSTGLHPAMTEIRDMYNNGNVSIIQSVAYANQNFSHFRSTDIWMTGSNSDQVLSTGWSGRYLDYEYPKAPSSYPSAEMPDPLAIQIGNSVSQVFWGANGVLGYSLENTNSFYNLVNGNTDPTANTYFGDELKYIREVSRSANAYATSISNASRAVSSQYNGYPSGNTLADHLKIVARLIKGGLKTRMYLVTLGSFDTHSNQVNSDNLTGTHPNLLSMFSKAVKAFHEDLKLLNIDKRVIGMTFSEFGRRIKSNASRGTDHGLAAPMFVFGSDIKGGIIGTNPDIPAIATVNDNVAMQYDYKQVYSTILKDWFCAPNAELNSVFINSWPTLSLIQPGAAGNCNPVTLVAKNITLDVEVLRNSEHALTWDVLNDNTDSRYEIQYSKDGVSFDEIGQIKSDGNLHESSEYQYLHDPDHNKIHYYRIRMVSADGSDIYSNVVKKVTTGLSLSVYPVPAVNFINIKMNQIDQNSKYDIRLISTNGTVIWQRNVSGIEFSASIYRVPVSSMVPGTYILQLHDQNNLNYNQRIQIIK
ncbi:MAG: DUF1501 domain-containing protein [Saprospiraceae bacterium]